MYKRELQDLLIKLNKKWSVISVTGPYGAMGKVKLFY